MSARTVPLTAIVVGERDREDLEIDGLVESIRAVGLLHPVVVTEALALVAGDRRLAAVRKLGWTEVPVTVVTLETVADVLRAEADENTERKPLTPYEASRARERRARVLAEDAAKRKAATQAKPGAGRVGGSNLDPPKTTAEREATKTRKVAALGTGYSASTLDRVDRIRAAAERGVVRNGPVEVPVPEPVRTTARQALEDVKKTGAAVQRAAGAVDAAIDQHLPKDPDGQYREWRRRFMGRVRSAHAPTLVTVEQFVECADDGCFEELRRLAEHLNDYYSRVRVAWMARYGENVVPMKRGAK